MHRILCLCTPEAIGSQVSVYIPHSFRNGLFKQSFQLASSIPVTTGKL